MLNRRHLLGVAGAAGATALSSVAAAQPQGPVTVPTAGPALRARRDVMSAAAQPDLDKYRSAVSQLSALPSSDPRAWHNLAQQHAAHCPHTNWWFLPWHRAYLHYFERICQDVLGDPTFAVPYWDWTQTPRIPGVFWKGVLAGNGMSPPLRRDLAPNSDIDSDLVGRTQVIQKFMTDPGLIGVYSSAPRVPAGQPMPQRGAGSAGMLEATPHNGVHNQVGGTMGTMLSPLDPIFWLHHANVDRLWVSWQTAHGFAVPQEAEWGNLQLERFWDPATRQSVAEPVARTRTTDVYGYTYDRLERAPEQLRRTALFSITRTLPPVPFVDLSRLDAVTVLASSTAAIKVNTATQTPLKSTERFDALMQRNSQAVPAEPARPVTLILEDVIVPTGTRTALRVFLNCASPSPQTSTDDPSYVGTVCVFGQEHAHTGSTHPSGGTSFALDATQTLVRLTSAGAYKPGVVDVALVLVSPDARTAGLVIRPGRVALVAAGT